MNNDEPKKITKSELAELEEYINLIDPENKVFKNTKKIISVIENKETDKDSIEKLYRNLA